ncbi:hypothetical protein HW126_13200 [Salinispora sp. H7-4]|nr:hypothetical protein [Salinispora sp. H7-4]
MGDERTVLVLTQPYDVTADYVVAELAARDVPVFRCDPGDFPQRLTLVARWGEGWRGSLRLPSRRTLLHNLGCAYYRRPTAFALPAHLTDEERRWAAREARMGLGGCSPRTQGGSTTHMTSPAPSTSRPSSPPLARPGCPCPRH